MQNERIHVCGALTRHSKKIESTKTEKGDRYVDLLPPALDALRAQKEHTGSRWESDEILCKGQWTTLCRRAGVRYRPPGQMRHTFASMTLMAGESLQWVAQMMGHTEWEFIARVYYRWIPRDKGEAGKKAIKAWT